MKKFRHLMKLFSYTFRDAQSRKAFKFGFKACFWWRQVDRKTAAFAKGFKSSLNPQKAGST
jgi:acyl-CoA synthetase (AMP-forming)/AMP-acid ligase II